MITSKDITQGEWIVMDNHPVFYNKKIIVIKDIENSNSFRDKYKMICEFTAIRGDSFTDNTEQIKSNAEAIANLPNLLKENESLRAINEELLEFVIEMDKDYNGLSFQDRLTDEGKLLHKKIKSAITKATK